MSLSIPNPKSPHYTTLNKKTKQNHVSLLCEISGSLPTPSILFSCTNTSFANILNSPAQRVG